MVRHRLGMSTERTVHRYSALVGILGTLVLSGCYRQWVSIGDMPADSGWHSEQRAATSIHRHSDHVIEVNSSNNSSIWNSTKKEFALSVRFYLKETGFRFDPQKVHLLLPGVQELAPQRIEMVATATGWESAWQCGNGPRLWIFSGRQIYTNGARVLTKETEQILSMGRESCFEFYFPVQPPSPDTQFSLRIRGFTRDDKPIEIPEVYFKKGSFWVFDFLGR